MNVKDKKIKNDTDVLYPLSTDYNDGFKKVTYRPPQRGFDPQWGQHKLNNWKEYLLQDPLTAEGRKNIASYNGFEDEWKVCEEKHGENTPVTKKLFDLLHLYAKNGSKHHVYFAWWEGQHRLGAMAQALTGSKIRETTGVIEKPSQLTLQDFIDYGLQTLENVNDDFNFQQHVEQALTSMDKETYPFLHEKCLIDVSWIKTTDGDVSAILQLARQMSLSISESKTTSVRKSAFNEIGTLGKNYIQSLSKDQMRRRPDTSGTSVNTVPVKKLTLAKATYEDLEKINNKDEENPNNRFPLEQEAFPSFDYLWSEEYVKYAQNPFDVDRAKAVYKKFEYTPMNSKGKKILKPPYANTHKSLAIDPFMKKQGSKHTKLTTKCTKLTTWQINTLCLYPPIFHYLSAEESNTTVSHTTKSDKVKKRILYAVRYHMASKLMEAVSPHGALDFIYGEPMPANLVTQPMDIIGATYFIVDSINAVLSFITDESSPTTNDFIAKRTKAANLIGTTYSTIPIKDGSFRVADIIQALGKIETRSV